MCILSVFDGTLDEVSKDIVAKGTVSRHKYKGERTRPLREELSRTGNFLFRWKSHLPLFVIVLILLAMPYFEFWMDASGN